jgi:hypothetical protein
MQVLESSATTNQKQLSCEGSCEWRNPEVAAIIMACGVTGYNVQCPTFDLYTELKHDNDETGDYEVNRTSVQLSTCISGELRYKSYITNFILFLKEQYVFEKASWSHEHKAVVARWEFNMIIYILKD